MLVAASAGVALVRAKAASSVAMRVPGGCFITFINALEWRGVKGGGVAGRGAEKGILKICVG